MHGDVHNEESAIQARLDVEQEPFESNRERREDKLLDDLVPFGRQNLACPSVVVADQDDRHVKHHPSHRERHKTFVGRPRGVLLAVEICEVLESNSPGIACADVTK